MNTDSNSIAISADRLEDIALPDLRQQSSSGLHGTSGAGVLQGCSNANVKAAGCLRYVRCATMLTFEYGVEGFGATPFSLIATAGFCQPGG